MATCPTFNEDRDWSSFNESCLFFSLPDQILGAVKTCCPTAVTIDNGCHTYCNFTTIPQELNIINCLHTEGEKKNITDEQLREAHPSCYLRANDYVSFTWIDGTLTTTTTTKKTSTTTRSVTLTTTGGNGGVGTVEPTQSKVGGMGIPIFSNDAASTTSAPAPQVTVTVTPVTTTPAPVGSASRGMGRSKAALALVGFVLWSVMM